MKAPITAAQAMAHPDVVLTINTLGQMADEIRAECYQQKEALRVALEALEGVLDREPGQATQFWSVSGGVYEAVQCSDAIAKIKEVQS